MTGWRWGSAVLVAGAMTLASAGSAAAGPPAPFSMTTTPDFGPAGTPLAAKLKPARPLWLDVQNGKAYPVFDVHRGEGGADGLFTYPDDAHNPYGNGAKLNEWTVDRDGSLIVTAGHVHPGGLWTDLRLSRAGRCADLFRSVADYFVPHGPVS